MDSGIDALPDEATGARNGGHHVLFPRSRGFGWLPLVRLGPLRAFAWFSKGSTALAIADLYGIFMISRS